MGMSVVESRQNPPVSKIDAPRVLSRQRQNLLVRADGQDSAVADRDRRGHRCSRIHGVDEAVVQNDIRIRAAEAHQRQCRESLHHIATIGAHEYLLFKRRAGACPYRIVLVYAAELLRFHSNNPI